MDHLINEDIGETLHRVEDLKKKLELLQQEAMLLGLDDFWTFFFLYIKFLPASSTFQTDISEEIKNLVNLFADFDQAFENGIILEGRYYAVHRFYDKENIIYGRSEELAPKDNGIAVTRVDVNGKTFNVLIIYVFPTLSARAVPLLIDLVSSAELKSKLSAWGGGEEGGKRKKERNIIISVQDTLFVNIVFLVW